jgi:hypothetical protein
MYLILVENVRVLEGEVLEDFSGVEDSAAIPLPPRDVVRTVGCHDLQIHGKLLIFWNFTLP